MDRKQDPTIHCLKETHFSFKDKHRFQVKGWKNIFHQNGSQKKAGMAILISDKSYFKLRMVIRDKEGHDIIIKGSLY